MSQSCIATCRICFIALAFSASAICVSRHAFAQESAGIKFKVQGPAERLTITVNTSRIIDFPFDVPKMLVNNPDLVRVVPISPRQIQVSAQKQGVTQLNIWDMSDKVTTIDLTIVGDVQELDSILKQEFPDAALRLRPLNASLNISGFVPKAEDASRIAAIARDYFPNIINGMTVGGVQKVLLHVKVLEVSRTKLRQLGVDWANVSNGGYAVQGISGQLPGTLAALGQPVPIGATNIRFGINNNNEHFYAFIQALKQNNLAKLLSEPTLTTTSGRAASFNVGGEIPIPVPSGFGNFSIQFREFGTQIDFVPIVLGNGNVKLEVRAQVTEVDPSLAVAVGAGTVPGFRSRRADTGVEMKTGQTLAIAGLVFNRKDVSTTGIPLLMDAPWIGSAFRKVSEKENEVELVIMVTPEFAEAMDPTEVPACGPGESSTSPTDAELYFRGYIEVPKDCKTGACQPMGGGYDSPTPAGPQSAQRAIRGVPLSPSVQANNRGAGENQGAPGVSARRVSISDEPQSRLIRKGSAPNSRKPTAGGKPALIGPTGYDDLK